MGEDDDAFEYILCRLFGAQLPVDGLLGEKDVDGDANICIVAKQQMNTLVRSGGTNMIDVGIDESEQQPIELRARRINYPVQSASKVWYHTSRVWYKHPRKRKKK